MKVIFFKDFAKQVDNTYACSKLDLITNCWTHYSNLPARFLTQQGFACQSLKEVRVVQQAVCLFWSKFRVYNGFGKDCWVNDLIRESQ